MVRVWKAREGKRMEGKGKEGKLNKRECEEKVKTPMGRTDRGKNKYKNNIRKEREVVRGRKKKKAG